MLMRRGFWTALALLLVGWGSPTPGEAWTQASQESIALDAARLAPPDLYRQLRRNRAAYLQGVGEPFAEYRAEFHQKHADGGGRLDEALGLAVEKAILSIQLLRPFNEISYRLGVVSHYVSDLNNPLHSSQGDPAEARYYADYLHYVESAQPRFAVVFYGFDPQLDSPPELRQLWQESLERSRHFYGFVGREYRRVGFASGRRSFDDRSAAFGIASLSHSHAVSDVAGVFRYIWLQAGGVDNRRVFPLKGRDIVPIPRPAP